MDNVHLEDLTDQPVIIDGYCGEGGAGEGYSRAGFFVLGVDHLPRMRHKYPHAFLAWEMEALLKDLIKGKRFTWRTKKNQYFSVGLDQVAALHVSPPCQGYSITKFSHDTYYPKRVDAVRELLLATGLPYVIENVEGAPLRDPICLCGSHFGLRATDTEGEEIKLQRHRLFESNVPLLSPGPHNHDSSVRTAGVYGGGRAKKADKYHGGYVPLASVRRELMGAPWMTQRGLSEAIPPAYTEFVGKQLMEAL